MKLRYRILLASFLLFVGVLIGSAPAWPSPAGVEVPHQLSGFISGVLLTAALLFVTGVPFTAPHTTSKIPPQEGFLGNLLQATTELETREAEEDRQNALDSAHNRAIAQLQKEKDRLQLVLDSATGLAVVAFDSSGLVTLFNAGAERMFGYLAAEVVGLASVEWFIDPEELSRRREGAADRLSRPASAIEGIAEVLRYRNEEETTVSYLRKNREGFVGQVSLSRLRDAGEASGALLAISRDVTKRIHKITAKAARPVSPVSAGPRVAKPAIADMNADESLLQDHLDRLGKENPELTQSLAHSFLDVSPPAFERLIATVLSQQWAAAGDAVRELRAGACRLLVPELDSQLNQIENFLLNDKLIADDVPIEPAFALYQLARALTREWLSTYESNGGTSQSSLSLHYRSNSGSLKNAETKIISQA